MFKKWIYLWNFLRNVVQLENIDIRTVYYRAGEWFLKEGNLTKAFDCYYRTGRIEELLEKINGMDNLNIGFLDIELQKTIVNELSRDAYSRYPFPYLCFACNFILNGDDKIAALGIKIVQIMYAHFYKSEGVLPMLNHLSKDSQIDSRYLGRLVNLCELYKKFIFKFRQRRSLLSSRELEVLHLMAKGMTQKEMASSLYLSISSIKFHLQNIYQKLGVKNKLSALKRAGELKIL